MAYDVFVSYSSKDKPTADAVCAVLESHGIRCWVAPRDILPGRDWGGSIIEAIKGARAMVLVFSANANTSTQIKREVERAVSKGIPVIPLRIEDVTPTETLEYFLSTPHWLDAFTPPLEQHLEYLVDVVQKIIGQPSARRGKKRELSATPTVPLAEPASVRAPESESKGLAEPSEATKRAEPKAPALKSSIRESAPKPRRRMPLIVGALSLLVGAILLVSVIVLKNQVQTGQKSGELSSSSKSDEKSNVIEKWSSFETVLAGHRWEVRSQGLACQALVAVFHTGGTFEGMLKNPPNDYIIRPQQVSGVWQVVRPILLLTYNYTDNLSGPAKAGFKIQITKVSERSLSGVDDRVRSWEFDRLD